VRFEVLRRTDDCLPHLRSDAHCDHILFDEFTDPNAGIETLAHDVGQALVSHELDRNLGVLTHQLRQPRPEHRLGCVLGRGDANDA
jgi:hypothetical protein